MPRVTTPWCAEEIALLKDMHGCMSYRDIAHLLGRTRASVASMRYFLSMPNLRDVERRWTEAENDFLLNNHRILTSQEIANRLDRTRAAVRARIRDFRLSGQRGSPRRWTEAEETYLLLAWPTDTLKDIADALGRTVYAVIRRAANELKISRPSSYYASIGRVDLLLPPELRELMTLNKKLKKGLLDAEHRRLAGTPLRGTRGTARKSDRC